MCNYLNTIPLKYSTLIPPFFFLNQEVVLHINDWHVLTSLIEQISIHDLRNVRGDSGRLVNTVFCIKIINILDAKHEGNFWFNIIHTWIVIKPECKENSTSSPSTWFSLLKSFPFSPIKPSIVTRKEETECLFMSKKVTL